MYEDEPLYCPNIMADETLECSLPIVRLRSAPFNLVDDDNIYARVLAYNTIGDGAIAEGSGAIVSTIVIPDAPINLARDPTTTTTSQVGLTWEDGPSNGGLTILDYRVSFDQGGGNYIVVLSGLTDREYIKTTLVQGQSYNFRVEARNSVGYSTMSEPVTIICAIGPAKPGPPSTAVVVNDVIISWT